jgi:alpha-tubulin suppressor-like RCC1 family protein
VALVVAVPATLCACASILDIEPVAYEGDDGGAETTTMPPPDASDGSDACSGSTCGARCCTNGATCIDGGLCSTDVVAVSGGGTVSCALIADGTVYCWGQNMLGQVGVAPAGDDTCTFFPGGGASIDEPCRWHPTRVQGLPPASGVWAGAQLACATEADGGAVWCWGRNATGGLGHDPSGDPRCSDLNEVDGATTTTSLPCSSTPRRVDGISDVVELAVGTDAVCARTKAGSVSCWGGGDNGERGDGEGGVRTTPGPVVGLPANDPITQIAAPTFVPATCAVSASGHAWCWGSGLVIESGGPTASPVTGGTAGPLTGLVEIRPAEGFICARQSAGIVICWGLDDSGYLGRGQCNDGVLNEDTVIGLPKNVALDSRWSHACALDDGGIVRCWGFGENGAVGVGGIAGDPVCSTKPGARPTPASVLNVPPMAQIATGIETTFAITRDGKLWAWGANDLARIGHEPNTGGDLINCGTANKTICDPVPKPVFGLP